MLAYKPLKGKTSGSYSSGVLMGGWFTQDKIIYRWIITQMLSTVSWYLSWMAQIELSKYF